MKKNRQMLEKNLKQFEDQHGDKSDGENDLPDQSE